MKKLTDTELIEKYNISGPRYTSYPPVPNWQLDKFDIEKWNISIDNTLANEKGISIYIHLPYCESLCTFCACHKRITTNHLVEASYIEAVIQEWKMYKKMLSDEVFINEIHLGGGTPSFFSPSNLNLLISSIIENNKISANNFFSFEGHPSNTTFEHLQTLCNLGFRRVSFGVQDYDIRVQKAIHRIQSFEQVKNVTELARQIGFTSVSHDLVFGLPFQELHSIKNTIEKTLELKPERIAYYSYAHVPWIKGTGQRGFNEKDLPSPTKKRKLYELGLEMFEKAGYKEVGMDHFALPNDELFEAMNNKTLHRNFMGYTVATSKIMIGLGASAIGDSWYAFGQNIKDIEHYKKRIFEGDFPIEKGHILSKEDLFIRQQILNIMCEFKTNWENINLDLNIDFKEIKQNIMTFVDDELIELTDNSLIILDKGKPFVRNISMAFDQYLGKNLGNRPIYSKTI